MRKLSGCGEYGHYKGWRCWLKEIIKGNFKV